MTVVRSRDVFHVLSRDFDHVSTFRQRDVVAASCSSERNVLYARIFVKSVDVTKQCIPTFTGKPYWQLEKNTHNYGKLLTSQKLILVLIMLC